MESLVLAANPDDASDRIRYYRDATLIFALAILLHVPLIATRSADPSYVMAYWQDEYNFLEHTRSIQELIATGNIPSLLTIPLKYAYGYVYQITYAILLMPFYLCGSFTGELVAGRLLGLC